MSYPESCVSELTKLYSISPEDVIIDPCARDGSLLSLLVLLSDYVVGYDKNPRHIQNLNTYEYILKVDYLSLSYPAKPIHSKMFVVGKPPDKLIKEFILHSCNFADVIAFVFPNEFTNSEDYFSLNFTKQKRMILEDGIFEIWERMI